MHIVLIGPMPIEKELFPLIFKKKEEGSFFIAVDGGCNHFPSFSFSPDFLIGDMDSIDPLLLKKIDCPKEIHPTKKNLSDFFLALELGKKLGGLSFMAFGFLGGRIDHTLANLNALYHYPSLILYQKEGSLSLIQKKAILSFEKETSLSFFSFEKNTYISSKGLYWEMEKMPLSPFSFSLSNISKEKIISIELTGEKKEALLFIQSLPSLSG